MDPATVGLLMLMCASHRQQNSRGLILTYWHPSVAHLTCDAHQIALAWLDIHEKGPF